MCCCGKPVVNGEMGYRWQPNDAPSVREVSAPELGECDTLLFDEPGRCGGLDCHSHHFRVVSNIGLHLLVRHGGGDERFRLSSTPTLKQTLEAADSNQRYWILNAIYYAHSDGKQQGHFEVDNKWRAAAAQGRIKTRKQRNADNVKVWIEPKISAAK